MSGRIVAEAVGGVVETLVKISTRILRVIVTVGGRVLVLMGWSNRDREMT